MNKQVEMVARSEVLTLFSRAAIIVLTLFVAPFTMYMITRASAQSDDLHKLVIQQNVELRVLSSKVDEKLDYNFRQLTDHELRLRQLERR